MTTTAPSRPRLGFWAGLGWFGISTVLFRRRDPIVGSLIVTDRCNLACRHCAVAGIAYFLANAGVQPDKEAHTMHVTRGQMSGGTFVLWVTFVSFAVAVSAALGIQNALAKKAWRAEQQIPKAKIR